MNTAAIPSLRDQIEQLAMCASRTLATGTATLTEEGRRRISAASSDRGRKTKDMAMAQYMSVLRKLGKATVRQLADELDVSPTSVKARMIELKKLGLVRDLGSVKLRIYEAV